MKSNTVYELWVGYDLVADVLSLSQAKELVIKELEQKHGAEIVLDEITHHTITSVDDIKEM